MDESMTLASLEHELRVRRASLAVKILDGMFQVTIVCELLSVPRYRQATARDLETAFETCLRIVDAAIAGKARETRA